MQQLEVRILGENIFRGSGNIENDIGSNLNPDLNGELNLNVNKRFDNEVRISDVNTNLYLSHIEFVSEDLNDRLTIEIIHNGLN